MNSCLSRGQKVKMTIDPIDLDCARLNEPDVAVIDRIARLQLAARELGLELRLVNVSPAVLELVDFCGLRDALGVEVQGQPEERKQAGRVEEEGDVRDPAV
jgi:anti-anti-sigma regulatory factor